MRKFTSHLWRLQLYLNPHSPLNLFCYLTSPTYSTAVTNIPPRKPYHTLHSTHTTRNTIPATKMSSALTPAQHKMLAAGFQCFDAQPKVSLNTPRHLSSNLCWREHQVDYNKLAKMMGLKNAASAKTGWCALRKKLLNADPAALLAGAEEAAGEGEAGKAKSAGKGKKRKAAEDEDVSALLFPARFSGTDADGCL